MSARPASASAVVPLSPDDVATITATLQEEVARADADLATQQRVLATLREDGSWSEASAQDVIRTCLSTMEAAEDHRRLALAALARIESGTYGRCESCHLAIPSGRLLARPSGTLCVRCSG